MKSPHTWTKYCKVLNMDEDSERLSPQVLAALGKHPAPVSMMVL